MRGLRDFETQDHVVLLEVALSSQLDFLELAEMGLLRPVRGLQETCPLSQFR